MALQTIRTRSTMLGTGAGLARDARAADQRTSWPQAFPTDTVIAVFGGRPDAATALRELHEAGIVPTRTWQASGLGQRVGVEGHDRVRPSRITLPYRTALVVLSASASATDWSARCSSLGPVG